MSYKYPILALLVVLSLFSVNAQDFSSSHLPIFIIRTDINPETNTPNPILDEPKTGAHLKILYVNDTVVNYLSNQNDNAYLNYSGRIAIELRGSTSQNHSKKSYGFETRLDDDVSNNNVPLLGLPAENDWVLNAMNDEPSYLRDCLSYHLYEQLGYYSPRVKYCEVIVNGTYMGLYILVEKIKVDKNRVNIEKMAESDNQYPAVSGGYIIKADKTTGGDSVAWSTPAYNYYEDVNYIFHAPKPELISSQQASYIHDFFDTVTSLIATHDQDVTHGYPAYIDVSSFVDFMIMGEFSSNVDIYQKSTFFHKDRGGKLRAGPIWDFNLAYGYDFGSVGRSGYDVLQFYNNDNTGSDFWHQLYEDDMFRCVLNSRWNELTVSGAPLGHDNVFSIIDSLRNFILPAVVRDMQRWSRFYSYTSHINEMKQWLANRYAWLNNEWTNEEGCLDEEIPPLVISKINYHPESSHGYPANSLEFIGITNNSTDTVDASGCYFSELGISFMFPENSKLAPYQEVYVASNPEAFTVCYGQPAIGQFLRNLSNKSQRLQLSDPWGRVIDDVTYYDALPWPTEADGDGDFLSLLDLNLDNNLGESWTTASEIVGVKDYCFEHGVVVAPNPTNGPMNIKSDNGKILFYRLLDVSGRVVDDGKAETDTLCYDISGRVSGIYFLTLILENGISETVKIIKR